MIYLCYICFWLISKRRLHMSFETVFAWWNCFFCPYVLRKDPFLERWSLRHSGDTKFTVSRSKFELFPVSHVFNFKMPSILSTNTDPVDYMLLLSHKLLWYYVIKCFFRSMVCFFSPEYSLMVFLFKCIQDQQPASKNIFQPERAHLRQKKSNLLWNKVMLKATQMSILPILINSKVFLIWSLVTGSIQDGHNICACDGK